MGNGVFLIDTEYVRPGLAASHLIVDDGRAAFVDTGTAPAVPQLLAALDELGIARDAGRLGVPHARAPRPRRRRGPADAALPNAKAVLHPRGAPHLVDPTKLVAGSIEVYGERALPARCTARSCRSPPERVLVTQDGARLALGRRTFEFIHTPGHALHHHCSSTSTTATSSPATPSASPTASSTRPPARSCSRRPRRCISTRTRCTPRSTAC